MGIRLWDFVPLWVMPRELECWLKREWILRRGIEVSFFIRLGRLEVGENKGSTESMREASEWCWRVI